MTNTYTYFIANWKMFGLKKSVFGLKNVVNLTKSNNFKNIKIVYCPPVTILSQFHQLTKNTKISLGAQNCHHEKNFGPHTGNINAKMIKDVGAKYVILGHSDSRNEGDTDELINKKIKNALLQNLKIIFCIGENLKERKNNKTFLVIKKQIFKGLENVKSIDNIIFAYEPVWSIGSGKVLTADALHNDILNIKKIIQKKYKFKNPKILYGGSVNEKNILKLKNVSLLNGFLIGGASQNQKKFIDIIKKTFK